MDIRRAYHRRNRKQARLRTRMAIVAMVAAAGYAAWLLRMDAPPAAQLAVAAPAARAVAAPVFLRVAAQPAAAARRVYPYSIVPGGVGSRAELVRAILADKLVAAHYAGIAVEKMEMHTVAKARAVYVSYRKGERVYWTARRVTLAQGETVLSDGENDIRGRCGNRIYDVPRQPVEAKGPDELELDTPVGPPPDGELRSTSFVLEDLDGGGQNAGFTPQIFPDGAGLLAASRTPTVVVPGARAWDRIALAPAREGSYKPAGFTMLSAPAPAAASDSASSENTGDKPAGPGQPPPPESLRPDGLPSGSLPAKPSDAPEPDSLWLTGAAFAALLLQRRLRKQRASRPSSGAAADQ
jgi:hypothetical protein